MVEQLENRPDKNPLPILLFLAMFPVYAVGIRIGLDIGFSGILDIFSYSEGDQLQLALILSAVPFLVILTLSLIAIRMIASGARTTAGIILYMVCCVLCLLVGMIIVPSIALL